MPSTAHTADPAMGSARRGQPRPADDTRQPTAAERVRTLVESDASAALAIPGADLGELGAATPAARTVTPDGDILLLVPGDSPAARAAAHAQDDDVSAVMEITDVAPVAAPHRIRGRAWVAGWVTPVRGEERRESAMLLAERHPVAELLGLGEVLDPDADPGAPGRPAWTLLRLEVGEAAVDDLWGAESVEPDDFARADADPLVRHEGELLQHLAASHGEQIRLLCDLLGDRGPEACAPDDASAVPIALDRFGLRVRFFHQHSLRRDGPRGHGLRGHGFDARFDFPEPVHDVLELSRAMHRLFESAADGG